jgi:PAS domain-containing protein
MLQWNWIALGALGILVIYQQSRMYLARRESKQREELFKIVTENAADMIALVDVKGRRLYNSPAYKRILGYSAAEVHGRSRRHGAAGFGWPLADSGGMPAVARLGRRQRQ